MKQSTQRSSALFILLLLGVALGARITLALSAESDPLVAYAGRTAIVEGVVVDDPDRRSSAVRVALAVTTVSGVGAEGKILVVLPRDTQLQYGDHLSVRGSLELPEPFETDTGRIFDYPGYLKARGMALIMPHATVRATEQGTMSVLRSLFWLKHRFEDALSRVMSEPAASFMKGLLLGERSGLPEDLTKAFIAVGLIHVVVLSGYNIGIVAEWTLRLFAAGLPRRSAIVVAGVVVVGFALMAGGGMATVRAMLMGLIALLARYFNRPAAALRALFVAASAMVLWNPLVLFDVGFILSIAATFGLITLSPWVETKLGFLPAGAVRSAAATTVAVQLFVLPALLYFTGVLSIVSAPLNVAVLPVIPLSMLLGFVAGTLALLHPYVALLPALLAGALLDLVVALVNFSAGLPFAVYVVPPFGAWVVAVVYLPLLWWATAKYRQTAAQQLTN